MARAFSIKMFIPDGDPEGLRIITKSHWTGEGVVFNRSIFNEVKKRDEFSRPGVYVLIGEEEESTMPKIYIGEAECVIDRLSQHYSRKEFWNWCIFFSSSADGSLNKAHVKYIEAKLIEKVIKTKLCTLDNEVNPKTPVLSEAEIADAEGFLEDMLDIYPLVGLDIFKQAEKPRNKNKLFYINAKGVKATGYEASNGFVVCEGSEVYGQVAKSADSFVKATQDELLAKSVLVKQDDKYIFTQDYKLNSPSRSACVVLGRNSNGRIEWKDKNGRTLKEIQERCNE